MKELFVKKISSNKTRLILTVAIYSVCLFLAWFITTIGMNIVSSIIKSGDKDNSYRIIYVKKPEDNRDIDVSALESYKYTKIYRNSQNVVVYDDKDVKIDIWEYVNGDVIPGGDILYGSQNTNINEAIIGISFIKYMNLSFEEIDGKNISLDKEKEYKIIGVFDDSDDEAPSCMIRVGEETTDDCMWLIKAEDYYGVLDIVDDLNEKGFDINSHAEEIRKVKNYVGIVLIISIAILVVALIFVMIVLYGSLMNIMKDNYTFVAMIKAFGYTRKHIKIFISELSFKIIGYAAFFSVLMYCVACNVIAIIAKENGILKIYDYSVSELFDIRIIVIIIGMTISFAGVAIVNEICVNKLYKIDVYSILKEAER